MSNEELYKELFNLIGYMLTSARGLVGEPALYGPLRFIEGVSRLCDLLKERDTNHKDFYSRLKEKIDEKKFSVMTDTEAFIGLMDEVVLEFSRELKRL